MTQLLDMLAEPGGPDRPLGVVDRILGQLSDQEAERVRYCISNRAFPIPQIVSALAAAGHVVSETTLRAYRRRMLGQ